MAKTARAAIEDLLTCESCHAFYYVERAEDGARTRLRCTSCGHSRDVLLSGAKTNKWTIIDPNGEVKTFTEWDELVRSMAGSMVTAVRAKVPSDRPEISGRAMSEAPPPAVAEAKAPSNRPASNGSNRPEAKLPSNRPASNRPSPAAVEVPPMHEVQPIGPSVGPQEEVEEERKSLSGAALLDVTPMPAAVPKLSLDDSAPAVPATESDKSIEVALSEPALPVAAESKPESLVEALVSSMPEASAPPAAVEKTADVAPVAEKPQEPWDDDEAEVLSMRDIQVVPVADQSNPSAPAQVVMPSAEDRESQRNSSTPPPPARGALKTLPPAAPNALPPPTITFEDGKKSDPPPATAKKSDSIPGPAKVPSEMKGKSEPAKKDGKKSDVAVKDKDGDTRTANTVPPKRSGGEKSKPTAATAKAQVAAPEEGGRSWLLPAVGVAAAAAVVWWLANGSSQPTPTQTNANATAPTTTAAPENTGTVATAKPNEPSTTTTTTTATANATATTAAPTEKAATPTVKPTDLKPADPPATNTANTTTATGTEPKKPSNANLSMSEALDKAGQAKRSGDYATAKELYAKVLRESASNVEAHSGLGDIAKAQGDLAAAKASYQKALSSSPDYGPALLSLADVEWDMGDRAAAQQHYARIVAARGGSAPDRAKQRAGGENN